MIQRNHDLFIQVVTSGEQLDVESHSAVMVELEQRIRDMVEQEFGSKLIVADEVTTNYDFNDVSVSE